MKQQPIPAQKITSADIDTMFLQTRKIHSLYLVSISVYGVGGILIKWLIMGTDPGFVGLPATTYLVLITTLTIVSIILGTVSLVVLPRRNSPRNLVEREGITSSIELVQALVASHYTRISFLSAIAIFGLVLFFLNGDLFVLFAFGVAAFILLLLIFPRRKEWDEAQTLFK